MRTTCYVLIFLLSSSLFAQELVPSTCYESFGFFKTPVFYINHESSSEHSFKVDNLNEVKELKDHKNARVTLQFEVTEECDFQCNIKVKKWIKRHLPWEEFPPVGEISKCAN